MRDDIVIIGMAGRFPQAENLEQLHCNLSECRDSVRKMPKQRMKDTALPIDKKYMMAGYLDDIDKFDHKLFGISYKEAIAMDPTQRILLEVVYEAIENSGYSAQHFSSQTTSVIVSEAKTDY